MVARPDLSTLVELPGSPTSQLPRRPGARRGARAHRPARAGAPRRGRARRARPDRARSGRSWSSSCSSATARAAGAVTSTTSAWSTRSARRPTRRASSSRCSRPARTLGLGAIASNHEFMNSQYEINLREATPLDAADNAFRFKAAVKDHAAQRGLLATFMGKPFNDQGGSGTHLHISLERDGAQLHRRPRRRRHGLSTELRHFVGGVLEHAPALMAFLNPTINAYRRILPDSLAPIARQLGPEQPHHLRADPARARRRLPGRAPGRRRRRQPAPGDRRRACSPASTASGASSIRRQPLEGDAYTLPEEEQGDAAADVARRGARRARGRRGAPRGRRRGDRRHVPRR